MSKIPASFIEELKEKTDLVKFIKQYTPLKLVGRGIWQGPCPHPNHNDSTPSFTVWEKTNSWSCYGCHSGKKGIDGNKGSDIYAFVEWLNCNNDFRAAVKTVADWNGVVIPNDENQKYYDKNYKLANKYQKDLLTTDNDILDYLYERGLDDVDIEKWKIGYDKLTNRLSFPLLDRYNNVIGFTKRVIDKNYRGGDKYKNSASSSIFNKSKFLYGINDIDDSYEEIIITEGSMDVILSRKYGLKNVVASLGTSFTEQHAETIYKMGKVPVLIFDGDEAGNKALKKALAYFNKLGVYCKIVKLPDGKDLADLALEYKFNLTKYIKSESVTAGYFKIKDIIDEYNSSIYEIRLKIIPKLTDILESVPLSEKQAIKSFVKDIVNISI